MKKCIVLVTCLFISMFASSIYSQTVAFVKYQGYLIPVQERDSDGDGVYDRTDICSSTEVGQSVDRHGCSVNQAASLVNCINSDSGSVRLGFVCYSYESTDSDQDSIIDSEDSYPHQPALMCTP